MSALAIVLGFGNSTERQLEPYARIWRKMGMDALVHIGKPMTSLAFPRVEARRAHAFAKRIVRIRGSRDIFVHSLSDNGFVALSLIFEEMLATREGSEARDAIRGIVFDSAPGIHLGTSRTSFARRFAVGMTPAVLRSLRRTPDARHPIVTPLLDVGFRLFFTRAIGLRMARAYDRVIRWQPKAPQLYLYGDSDVLVPPDAVEEHVAEQKRRGIEVSAIRFAGARHVACYPSAPETYRDAIAKLCAGSRTHDPTRR